MPSGPFTPSNATSAARSTATSPPSFTSSSRRLSGSRRKRACSLWVVCPPASGSRTLTGQANTGSGSKTNMGLGAFRDRFQRKLKRTSSLPAMLGMQRKVIVSIATSPSAP